MNDLEIIEHWAVRHAIVVWTVAMGATFLAALAAFIVGISFGLPWLDYPGAALTCAQGFCVWKLRRLWRRVYELEKFIP